MKIDLRARAPLMIGMALILALPLVLTAGIGIYRAERAAPASQNPGAGDERGEGAGRDDAAPRAGDAR